MSNNAPAKQTIKGLFSDEKVKAKFAEVLGKKANGFITSVVQVTAQNKALKSADPTSVYMAAMVAATLDLPINPNLGFAYIIPYNETREVEGQRKRVQVGQFQMGYKGFIQLAIRTGQYKTLNAIAIDKAWLVSWNPMTEELILDFDQKETGEIVGYCAYFETVAGFTKTVYWSKEKVDSHAKKYSQAYAKGYKTPWSEADQYDNMALKTVIKAMLSKWGILSVEIQKAAQADQSVVIDAEKEEYHYVDNTEDQEAQIVEDDKIDEKPSVDSKKFNQIKQGIGLGTMSFEEAVLNYDLTATQTKELQEIEPQKS